MSASLPAGGGAGVPLRHLFLAGFGDLAWGECSGVGCYGQQILHAAIAPTPQLLY